MEGVENNSDAQRLQEEFEARKLEAEVVAAQDAERTKMSREQVSETLKDPAAEGWAKLNAMKEMPDAEQKAEYAKLSQEEKEFLGGLILEKERRDAVERFLFEDLENTVEDESGSEPIDLNDNGGQAAA